MSNPTYSTITYIVQYDGQTKFTNNIVSIEFQTNLHPRENTATITLAGAQDIEPARDITIYRVNRDGSQIQMFRGFSGNVTYALDSETGVQTTIYVESYWKLLEYRLVKIEGLAPPPFAPNTNPYLVRLNPLLNLTFGYLFDFLVWNGFTQSYSTGHLPPIVPGTVYSLFDNATVNDQLILQYFSVASAIERLWQSALFDSSSSTAPYIAEALLDTIPFYPTLNIEYYDPIQSAFGIGQNKTGQPVGNGPNTIYDPRASSPTPGSAPVDTIIFSEAENIVSATLEYDYDDMANSFVYSGANFRGAQIVAVPVENPSSIAQLGLKQQNKTLGNVIDPEEINTYIKDVTPLFQRPIPNIVIKAESTFAPPDTYGSPTYPQLPRINPGDLVILNIPSFVGVVKDMNGNVLSQPNFVARVRRISVTWDTQNGEDVTYTFILPIVASTVHGEGTQFLYPQTNPSGNSIAARYAQQIHDSVYNPPEGPIENVSLTFPLSLKNNNIFYLNSNLLIPGVAVAPVDITAQVMTLKTFGSVVSQYFPEQALIEGLWVTIYTTTPSIQNVYLRCVQPDGIVFYDAPIQTNYKIDLLPSLISARNSSGDLVNNLSGKYLFVISNGKALSANQVSNTHGQFNVVVEVTYHKDTSAQVRCLSAQRQAQSVILQKTQQWVQTPKEFLVH